MILRTILPTIYHAPPTFLLSFENLVIITANGIPIEGWTHDPSDEALLDLLPVLDSLRFTSDVRRVLGLRSTGAGVLQLKALVDS